MYAFRKPFAAASYEGSGIGFLGGEVELKTLFVVSQIIGYAISKYLGIRVCSETTRRWRLLALISLIFLAELALVFFGLVPVDRPWLKAIAIFANGLPLGMVWGMVVLYLEGRKTSELLLTGLSCSYIVASGFVKDVGRSVLAGGDFSWHLPLGAHISIPNPLPEVSDYWMPAITGAIFMPLFLLSAWLLDQIPDPDKEDVQTRTERLPMKHIDRSKFIRKYAIGIVAALFAYLFLTAFRDYRDNYMVEVLSQLGYEYESNRSTITNAELLVAIGVMAILSQLYRIQDNRLGLILIHLIMGLGLAVIGLATWLLSNNFIDGFWWITLIGFGAYLAYVPYGSVLFDRVIASTGFVGTAVFGVYLADAVGYTGSVAMQIGKDIVMEGTSQLEFLKTLSYLLSILGTLALALSCYAFLAKASSQSSHN